MPSSRGVRPGVPSRGREGAGERSGQLLGEEPLYRQFTRGAYETARRYETSRTVGRFMDIYRELALWIDPR